MDTLILLAALAIAAPPDEPEAPEPVSAQQLFLLDTAYTMGRGGFQIELAAAHLRGSGWRETELALNLEYGVTDRVDVFASVPAAWLEEENGSGGGLGDLELGGLLVLTPSGSQAMLTAEFSLTLPTGSEGRGLGAGMIIAYPGLLLSWDLGPVLVHANLVGELASGSAGVLYGAALEKPLGGFSLVAELSAESGEGETAAYLTPGAVWRTWDRVEWRLGVPVGLTDASADWGLAGGVVLEF